MNKSKRLRKTKKIILAPLHLTFYRQKIIGAKSKPLLLQLRYPSWLPESFRSKQRML